MKINSKILNTLLMCGSISIGNGVEITNAVDLTADNSGNEKIKLKENGSKPFFKERYIEKNNFIDYVREQNKVTVNAEANVTKKRENYETVMEGHQSLSPGWDLNYKIKRETADEKEIPKAVFWENELNLQQIKKSSNTEKVWTYGTVIGMKMNEAKVREVPKAQKERAFKFFAGQKASTYLREAGKGGTYLDLEGNIGAVDGSIRNGYSVFGNIKTKSNLGYGMQLLNSLEAEFLDYNMYDSALRTKLDTTVRWTYEFDEKWAFSPEVSLKAEKYFASKNVDSYNVEVTVAPYILYTQNINRKVRLYGKIGLPVYQYNYQKISDIKSSHSGIGGIAKIGIEYIY